MHGRILIVGAAESGAHTVRDALGARGYLVDAVGSPVDALAHLRTHEVDVALVIADATVCATVRALHVACPDLLQLVASDEPPGEARLAALRAGAYDWIAWPELDALALIVARAIDHVRLEREVHQLRVLRATAHACTPLIGDSPAIARVVETIRVLAGNDRPILIVGERGTGRERIARAIHDASTRADHPFVAVACTTRPADLLARELFGHVAATWPDTPEARAGVLARVGRGTVFLDDLCALPPALRAELVRTLESGRVRPVGATDGVAIASRVIVAVAHLEPDAPDGCVIRELHERAGIARLETSPLRTRPGDILAIAEHVLRRAAARAGHPPLAITPEAASALVDYPWPGNVVELEACLDEAVATARGALALGDLPARVAHHRRLIHATATGMPGELIPLSRVERRYVRQVIDGVAGNKSEAARILGIDRRSLYRRLDAPHTQPLAARLFD